MGYKIALAGNPNCGKTTMFNDLTGSTQYVGNWPGVTVEKKEGKLKGRKDVIVQDLPGIYSLSPYTLEEVVARNYLVEEKPDVILNIIDAANLERNLYLTTQLMELGIPIVLAFNMMDVVRKQGDKIQIDMLSKRLGCSIVQTSALKGEGSMQAAEAALKAINDNSSMYLRFNNDVETFITQIQELLETQCPKHLLRWYTIKLFEDDEEAIKHLTLSDDVITEINSIREKAEEELDDDAQSIITTARYELIESILKDTYTKNQKQVLSTSDKIDRIVTNRWAALPIFVLIMFFVYYLSISTIGTMMTDWVNDVLFGEYIPSMVDQILVSLHVSEWLKSLIQDGIIAGVGGVLGFLPQMLVLFLLLGFLEDCGYMARIAFIMDRIFRKFGLSGKSFIPVLIGTGCGVPAIQASRTIENERDRKMTIITTTFIPCSAKLPIIALIAGALFDGAWWVAPSAYFLGIVAIILSGILLKKTKLFQGDVAPFVMELPPYHMPRAKGLWIHTWDRLKAFAKKAGTIIFASAVILWFLQSFGWNLHLVEDQSDSILASLGQIFAPIFAPIGWGDWRATVATFTGLIAKENVVSTFGVLYGFQEVAEDGVEVWGTVAASFTTISAYSFLVFNLLCAPCFAAIGAIHREMGSAKWTWIAIGYQCGFAYVVSFILYQIGMWIMTGNIQIMTIIGMIITLVLLYALFRPVRKG